MKIVNIANEIHAEINYDSSTSIAAISYWLRGQLGRINNLLFEDFVIEETSGQYEIVDGDNTEISQEAVSVLKSLYRVYDYGVSVRSTMNALTNDSLLEFTDNLQGSTVRRHNKGEQAKTFASLKAAEQENLNDLIGAYRMRNTEPSQTVGDDTWSGGYDQNGSYNLRNWNNG